MIKPNGFVREEGMEGGREGEKKGMKGFRDIP